MNMRELSSFCRRVGISVNAGLSLVDAMKREASRQSESELWLDVVRSIENGNSLTDALRKHEGRLGEMFVAMIEIGEESGHLGEMLIDLSKYYDDLLRIRRDFMKSLTLPIVELVAALVIIGLIILGLGLIRQLTGNDIDIIGFGLVGVSGLIKYVIFLTFFFGGLFAFYLWMKRSVQRSRPVHYLLNRLPKIGALFRSLALMRLTWGLHLTLRTGMDVRRALTLSFRGVGYAPIADNLPNLLDVLHRGGTLTDAFQAARNLDHELITSIDSGEQSGSVPELMQRMSDMYFEESLVNLKTVSVVGGFAVYGLIMGFIAFMIFRIAMFYFGMLNSAFAGI